MPTTITKPEQLKKVANDAIDAAEERAVDTLESARTAARKAADKAADKAHQMESEINEQVTELSGAVARYVSEKPLQAAGMAFAAGVLATLLLKKK